MAYGKFTSLVKFCNTYHLQINTRTNIFEGVAFPDFTISEHLERDIREGKEFPLYTEKAKSELLILPILKELKRKNPFISVFSGFSLNIEGQSELNGNPDFVLSANDNKVEIEAPIFCLLESKNNAPDIGFAQCAAEMYAAKLFNTEMGTPQETIYGAVTNAYDWVFLRLTGDCVWIDMERYYLNDLNKLLGILQYIVNQYKK